MSRILSGTRYMVGIPVIGWVIAAPFFFLLGSFGRLGLQQTYQHL